ncbi:lipoprotein insertase outer membrane protein LolB [Celerinatantimonas sp. YJH-8]|uniref:lipoprotein insertase outer membrane protein LolB n=1 Tax=Celerinatantimonas sp. YJH-8 TaxID=3228714 RepID=UPI0038C6ABDB
MFRLSLIAFIVILLSGCVTPPQPPQAGSWAQQQQQLQHIQQWQLQGQIAIFTPSERHSASLYWQHLLHAEKLQVSGPFGKQLFSATINPQGATIHSDGKLYQGADASQLIWQLTGWQLPLQRLPGWMIGLPSEAHYQLGADHRISQMTTKDGWTIHYLSYQQVGIYTLPYLLEVQRDSIKIKLKINDWQLEPK